MDTRACYWCGTTRPVGELFHLEGARLYGSPELSLPTRLSERERLETFVCEVCGIAFADLRSRHDIELAEAAVRPGGTAGPARTVESIARKAIEKEG